MLPNHFAGMATLQGVMPKLPATAVSGMAGGELGLSIDDLRTSAPRVTATPDTTGKCQPGEYYDEVDHMCRPSQRVEVIAPVHPATRSAGAPGSTPTGTEPLPPGVMPDGSGMPPLPGAGGQLVTDFLLEPPKPWYKKPLVWAAIGGGVIVLGGGSYLLFRKR